MARPSACRHHIDQYLFGAAGVKPTCLQALNLGHFSVVDGALRDGMETWRTRPTAAMSEANLQFGIAAAPVRCADPWW